EHDCPDGPQDRARTFPSTRGSHEQASNDACAEVSGRGDQALRDAALGNQAARDAGRVWLDDDGAHAPAHDQGHDGVPAFVDPGRKELDGIQHQEAKAREADAEGTRGRYPEPIVRRPSRCHEGDRGYCTRSTEIVMLSVFTDAELFIDGRAAK